jgi:hypothetical protein
MANPFYAGGLPLIQKSAVARPTGSFDLNSPNLATAAPTTQPPTTQAQPTPMQVQGKPTPTKPTAAAPAQPTTLTKPLTSSATGGMGTIPQGARVAYLGGVPVSLSDNYAGKAMPSPSDK